MYKEELDRFRRERSRREAESGVDETSYKQIIIDFLSKLPYGKDNVLEQQINVLVSVMDLDKDQITQIRKATKPPRSGFFGMLRRK